MLAKAPRKHTCDGPSTRWLRVSPRGTPAPASRGACALAALHPLAGTPRTVGVREERGKGLAPGRQREPALRPSSVLRGPCLCFWFGGEGSQTEKGIFTYSDLELTSKRPASPQSATKHVRSCGSRWKGKNAGLCAPRGGVPRERHCFIRPAHRVKGHPGAPGAAWHLYLCRRRLFPSWENRVCS